MFARGKAQETLMKTLNWKGFDFMEVAPDYTSQICPSVTTWIKRTGMRKSSAVPAVVIQGIPIIPPV